MTNPPSFDRIEIEPGRSLHYLLQGPDDAPFVLFDAGAFGIYADGWWLADALKKNFRICLYDRAGMGASDPPPAAETPAPDFHVEDIRRLLRALGHDGKMILIGHSMAGLRQHAFANMYPEELAGLVFVDALAPRQLDRTHGRFLADRFGTILKAGAYGARIGLAAPVTKILAPNNFRLDGPPRADKVAAYAAASHHAASRDEVLAVDYRADYLHGRGIEQIPMAILASTVLNGMTEADALAAQAKTGFGHFVSHPKDNHVSILIGERAEEIAGLVTAIAAHSGQVSAPASHAPHPEPVQGQG